MSNIKNAKYRIKNEQGVYEVVHFETSMAQVQGLDEKVAEVEGLISDRYTKGQSDEMFRSVNEEIGNVEAIAEGLNTRLTKAEGDITGLQSDLEAEVSRATGVEAGLQSQIDDVNGKIKAINHAETGILKQAKDYTDEKVAEINSTATGLESALNEAKTELTGKIEDLAGVVEGNKQAIESSVSTLEGRVVAVEGRTTGLEESVADLKLEDARLAQEIQNVKDVIANQGSGTKVFATLDEFISAGLSPKVGDMVFVVDIKKAFIYKGADAVVMAGLENIPAGWILFDEITTEIDLVDYAKKDEVEALIATLDAKVIAETERAQGAEEVLDDAINALREVVAQNSGKISTLEGTVESQGEEISEIKETTYNRTEVEALIDSAVTAQMSYGGTIEPVGKKAGHVWIDFA